MQLLALSPQIHGAPPFLLPSPPSSSTLTLFCRTSIPPRHLSKHYPRRGPAPSDPLNLKSLTALVVRLTRRRQLAQIFEEIEIAKKQHGKLNIIVMNAVMQACVHCHDIDSALRVFDEMSKPEGCGVDDITYGTLLKGLGDAQRIDEAFQVLESVEKGTAVGSPQLSAQMICGLLNALTDLGDLLRANGLLARYGHALQEGGTPSVFTFNLLMKGYITAGCPQAALGVHDKILRHGLKPDRLSYNTLIFACIKNENLEKAMLFYEQMKGFGRAKDITSVEKIFTEMKSRHKRFIDRVAYTAVVDALLNCGSIKGALCIFGEIIKQAGRNPLLRPKPHLFLSMMRAFAARGDYSMVRRLQERMWFDSAGTISSSIQAESDQLLMEAALNQGQVDLALRKLKKVIWRWKDISWSSRGGMVAVRLEALLGINRSVLSPRILSEVSPKDAIERIMVPFEEASPLRVNLQLKQVVMRFFRDSVVPIIDEWGCCVGILHREDCDALEASLATLMRRSPPFVTSSTSVGSVIDLMLEKRYKIVIVVKYGDIHGLSSSSSFRAVGVFTYEQLCKLSRNSSEMTDEQFCLSKCNTNI